jgi:hypothetical protein
MTIPPPREAPPRNEVKAEPNPMARVPRPAPPRTQPPGSTYFSFVNRFFFRIIYALVKEFQLVNLYLQKKNH